MGIPFPGSDSTKRYPPDPAPADPDATPAQKGSVHQGRRSGRRGVLARGEVIGEPGAGGGVERVEEIERRSQGPLARAQASAAVGRELDTQAAAVESPGVDERTSAQLMNEVVGGLSRDEQSPADLAGMQLAGLVQELHHLELGEGDAELE
jgi:hypothetical protein